MAIGSKAIYVISVARPPVGESKMVPEPMVFFAEGDNHLDALRAVQENSMLGDGDFNVTVTRGRSLYGIITRDSTAG